MIIKNKILTNIWIENKLPIIFIYALNIIEEVAYLLIPSAVGLFIDELVHDKKYGMLAFALTYIGWQGVATYRRIRDTIVFTDIFNQLSLKVIQDHKQKNIGTAIINARVELLKQVVLFFEEDIPFLVRSVVTVIGSCFLLYFYNPKLLLISIIIILPSFIINYFYSNKIVTATQAVNDEYEKQIDFIETNNEEQRAAYFQHIRKLNIRKSTFQAYNFGLLEVFVFIMIFTSIFIVCKTENLNYGSIVASYGIILRLAYSFDFIPHIITRLALLKDITGRLQEVFE